MKKVFFILLFATIAFASCKKDKANSGFLATVLGKGGDCNTDMIQFDNSVTGLPGNTYNGVYYSINLPSAINVVGQKIKVEFRLPDSKTEALICTTLGPAYPAIVITKAE